MRSHLLLALAALRLADGCARLGWATSPGASHAPIPLRCPSGHPPRSPPAQMSSSREVPLGQAAVRSLYSEQKARAEEKGARAARYRQLMDALMWPFFVLQDHVGWTPRLQPHDIGVISLERELTADALARLLRHEACAVHVRGFCSPRVCERIEATLSQSAAFNPWEINRKGSSGVRSEVDKVGVVSGEALDSFDSFAEYLDAAKALDELLPGELNPFEQLRKTLDAVHPQGCRVNQIVRGRPMPQGTFRRMFSSAGLVHADTGSLLSASAGEFSANVYIKTPRGKGALNVYPAQQYSLAELPAIYALSRAQEGAYSSNAQEYLRKALPLKRSIDIEDGDLILINTGRFHEVEAYSEGYRLSGQCWISYVKDRPLYIWV
ncbi:hypothetical protein AB1Y20_012502 [Prymnesium parvum]|uniref:TauD/TfdA-like domain-containing protein n=1 Tax=Prymnesium parvum TaxID=97485 RepID=A0AB34IL08_PRYPA